MLLLAVLLPTAHTPLIDSTSPHSNTQQFGETTAAALYERLTIDLR